jgi:beta-glucanase (GH16 family)
MARRPAADLSRRSFLAGLAASTVAPSPPLGRAPSCGLTGWTLAVEYSFGTAGNVRDVTELRNLFTSDAPWGRINGELQTFQPFNPRNHVFERDHLALVAIPDGSGLYSQYGHITSGAVVTKLTCSAPCIVEFMAKLPAGRGVWPSLWLYDCHSRHNDSSEIDVMESQFNAPPGQRDDRSWVFQNDHGPGLGNTISNPGNLDEWGRWQPYGAIPGGDMSARWAAYSVCWRTDRVAKYVDNREAVTRAFTWTGPAEPNIIVYNSVGSDSSNWPGPVQPDTFTGDNAKFRIKAIRIFKPSV